MGHKPVPLECTLREDGEGGLSFRLGKEEVGLASAGYFCAVTARRMLSKLSNSRIIWEGLERRHLKRPVDGIGAGGELGHFLLTEAWREGQMPPSYGAGAYDSYDKRGKNCVGLPGIYRKNSSGCKYCAELHRVRPATILIWPRGMQRFRCFVHAWH